VEMESRKSKIANVLIVDNDPDSTRLLLEILARKGIHANLANDEKTAVDFLDKSSHDLVFTNIQTSQEAVQPQNGSALLKKIQTDSPELPVVMIAKNQPGVSSQELINTAVKAIQTGCCDFLLKPLDPEKIENILDTFLPNHKVSTIISADDPCRSGQYLYQIVGKSAKLAQVADLTKRISRSRTNHNNGWVFRCRQINTIIRKKGLVKFPTSMSLWLRGLVVWVAADFWLPPNTAERFN